MLLNEKAWYQNNTLRIRESNLEALEQKTIEEFFNTYEEQELEEGFGKRLLTVAAIAALGLSSLFAGINAKNVKDYTKFLPQDLVKEASTFVQMTNPGETCTFVAPSEEGGTGKLIVVLPSGQISQEQVENEVRKFCTEHNIDLNKWDFDEHFKGIWNPDTGEYLAIFDITKVNE